MNGSSLYLVLAKGNRALDALGSGLRGHRARVDSDDITLAVVAVVVTGLGLWFLSRYASRQQAGGFNGPRRLFWSLCKRHKLDWASRLLLVRLARSQRLRQPARLFLEPERFNSKNLSVSLRLQRNRLDVIRQKIFGDLGAAKS